jgi:transposase-like protein
LRTDFKWRHPQEEIILNCVRWGLQIWDPSYRDLEEVMLERFLGQALRSLKAWEKPQVINTDKAPPYAVAIKQLKDEGICPQDLKHRQVNYLNNLIEADHGKLKRLIKPTPGFQCNARRFTDSFTSSVSLSGRVHYPGSVTPPHYCNRMYR